MTALNIIVGQSAAWLATDMGFFFNETQLVGVRSKVTSSERLRVALAPVGDVYQDFWSLAAEWLDQQSDQAAMLEGLPGLMAMLGDELLRRRPPPQRSKAVGTFSISRDSAGKLVGRREEAKARRAKIFAALWDIEGHRPMGVRVSGAEKGGGWWCSGVEEVQGAYSTPRSDYVLPPVMDASAALGLVSRQRFLTDQRGLGVVRGGVELTTVTEQGVRTETICRWPDPVNAIHL